MEEKRKSFNHERTRKNAKRERTFSTNPARAGRIDTKEGEEKSFARKGRKDAEEEKRWDKKEFWDRMNRITG